jgi:excinuclease UvrABC ATPase subunit
LGTQLRVDPELIVPNPAISLMDGAIVASGWARPKEDTVSRMYFEAIARKYRFKLTTPFREIPKPAQDAIFYGTGDEKLNLRYESDRGSGTLTRPFEGIVNNLERRYRETQSPSMRAEIEELRARLQAREKELVSEKQANENLRQHQAASQQAMMARLAALESPSIGTAQSLSTNQSREARLVKLPSWMRIG